MANELTKPIDAETGLALAAGFGGEDAVPVTELSPPVIKMGKDDRFEVELEDAFVEKLSGHIVLMHATNAYFAASYGSGDNFPDCASSDGQAPDMGENKQCDKCAIGTKPICKYNQWGSGIGQGGEPTKGKRCNNNVMLYFLRDGDEIPSVIRVRSTSIGKKSSLSQFEVYVREHALQKAYQTVHVELSLERCKVGNFDSSKLIIKPVAVLEATNPLLETLLKWYRLLEGTQKEVIENMAGENGGDDDIPI